VEDSGAVPLGQDTLSKRSGRPDEAAEARRLGGLSRRKEKVVSGSHDIEGLENVSQLRKLVEIAVLDTLALENSIALSRAFIAAAGTAAKLLEVAARGSTAWWRRMTPTTAIPSWRTRPSTCSASAVRKEAPRT
jgi:hypothetical protein